MTIKILTIFPEIFKEFLKTSLLGQAQEKGLITIEIFNLRDWAKDKHKRVDDKPYGGKAGMVLKADIIDLALAEIKTEESQVILLTPQGKSLDQGLVRKLSKERELILICGRYEGFDERVRQLVDLELSIGDYILAGGEVPAMVIVESLARLIPGVVGKEESIEAESFSTREKLLDYPQYTLPQELTPKSKKIGKLEVPEILLSGDHQKIKEWRKRKAWQKTIKRK